MKFSTAASALVATCAVTATTVSAATTGGAPWGYKINDPTMAGPAQWADHYPTCGGSRQSPIDITTTMGSNVTTRSLAFSGECGSFNLTQSGETFKASVFGGSCSASANGVSYNMAQFHLHAPSEHTLNGKPVDGVVYFVHSKAAGLMLMVVGVFLQVANSGKTDPWMTSVLLGINNVSPTRWAVVLSTFYSLVRGVYNGRAVRRRRPLLLASSKKLDSMVVAPKRCRMLAVVAIVMFINKAVAQEAAGSFSTDRPISSQSGSLLTSSTGSDVGFVPATTAAEGLAQGWFSSNFWDNETQLAVGVSSNLKNLSSSDIICNGAPSLQRRSNEILPNFGCPSIFTAVDGSCTCLSTGYNDTNAWEFRVAKRVNNSELLVTQTATDILPIDFIRTLLVPPTLTTLRIIGDGDLPQDVQFTPEDRRIPGTVLPVAISPSGSISLSTVEITNINMFSITLSASAFLPPTTTNLTLRNCNLFGFGFHFFDGVTNLQHLDLSSNLLTVPYVGSTTQNSCSNQFCAIETLNLTNNSLTTFPNVVFNIGNLQELYIAHNDITDFNITNATFNAIKSLAAFESDLPDPSTTCPGGTWQTAHSSKFCVANSTIATPTESSSGTCTQCLVYVGIIGGCLVVVLVILLLWQRARTRRRAFSASSASSPSSYYLARSGGDTINFQATDKDTTEALLEDPIIVTNRINYKEVKLGKCLSRGGFGLVFVGEYKGRQVAVKKIRPDRSQDPKDVKAFLREIILMAELHHPRIVEFVGVAWDNLKHISAVTEFMSGGDLRHVIRSFKRQGSPLSWRNHKMSISLHIAEALQYLHSHSPKVIHRDLKSKNVLLNMHLEAKLTDFGVSRTQYTVQTHPMTAGIGTSFWIAPEVLLGRDYDEQADIYSFGVVLSEVDTDDYPYWNDANRDCARGKLQEADILRQVATGNKRPNFSTNCPAGIMLLAESCLQENPEDRPTAAAIVETLQQLLRSSLQPSSSDSSPSFASDSGWIAD